MRGEEVVENYRYTQLQGTQKGIGETLSIQSSILGPGGGVRKNPGCDFEW